MGAFFVVNRDPVVCDLADLIQNLKQISIQDLMPIGSVEPLDKGVLAGFTGLDVTQLDAFVLTLLGRDCRPRFRAVIQAYGLR
jgi:hypothetical protein